MLKKFNVFLLVTMLLVQSTYAPACASVTGCGYDKALPRLYSEGLMYDYVGSVATTPAGLKANPGDIARQFVSDSPYDGLYCSVSAHTVRSFDDNKEITSDPYFENGGYTMGTTEGTLKAYVICVDFEDCVGSERVEYGDLQNVFSTEGQEYDYSKPETYYKTIFQGSDGFKEAGEWTGEKEYHGIVKYFEELSYGELDFEVEFVNSMVPNEDGSWPWFRLPGEQRDWSIQYASGVEDYRIFARLHQGAVDAAYKYVPDLDMEDIGFLYVVTPVNTFGFREGLQGGAGIDTAFSYQDQALILRDTEMRHKPGVTTKGGRMIGSSTTITKGARGYDGADRSYFRVMAHETGHGLGLTDDYTYDGRDHVSDGEAQLSWYNPVGNWGIMAGMTADTPDWPAWYKFKAGWIDDDEIEVILPGETKEVFVSALGSKEGQYGQGNKMVLIPTEWRTTNTFDNKRWNHNGTDYNFFDWFTPVWAGGEQYGWKSFPTGFVLESRRAVGPDYANNSGKPGTQGVLVTQLSDLTWETGHGAAGLKVMYNPQSNLYAPCIGADDYAGINGDTAWEDTSRGVRVEVIESSKYGDRVKITYTGNGSGIDKNKNYVDVKRAYQGELTASDSYAVAGDTVTMDLSLFTLGKSADTGMKLSSDNPQPVIVREGSPLGVAGGVAGYTMTVSYDPDVFEYVSGSEDSQFDLAVEAEAGVVTMSAISGKMIKDKLLSLSFKVKDDALPDVYNIETTISDVALLDYNGNCVDKSTYTTKVDKAVGTVTVNKEPTYTISGRVTESRQGDIGVPAVVALYDKSSRKVVETKSLYNGQYSIPNVAAGEGYYIVASKHLYDDARSEAFSVASSDKTDVSVQLKLSTVTISGYVFGDSEDNPLPGARVQIVDDGFMPAGSEAVTDANGYYEVKDVPVMENTFYTVTASAEGYGNGYGPNYGISMEDLFSAVSDLENMNITLSTTYKIKGSIYPCDEEADYQVQLLQNGELVGEPVAVQITDSGRWKSAGFTIDGVLPGQNYTLEVSGNGYLSNRSTPFEILTSNILRKELTLLSESDAAVISGKVTDTSGSPLAGVSVGSEDVVLGNIVSPVMTDEEGNYTIYLPRNAELSLYYSRSGYRYANRAIVTADEAAHLNVTMIRQSSGGGSSATPVYTVKFDSGGGSAVSSLKAEKNKTIDEPKAPTYAGYTFAGWYTDKALTKAFDFDTEITGNITLYAKWVQTEAGVTEQVDSGKSENPQDMADSFADTVGHWASDAIGYVAEKGLMTGTAENIFSPDSAASRGMIVTILHRLDNNPTAPKQNFTDVDTEDWYSDAIAWASANNIVQGYGGGQFKPQESITREQLVAILYRYAQYKGYSVDIKSDLMQYDDSNSVSSWAETAMKWAVGTGLMQGRANGELAPSDNVTRAEIAVLLRRFIEITN